MRTNGEAIVAHFMRFTRAKKIRFPLAGRVLRTFLLWLRHSHPTALLWAVLGSYLMPSFIAYVRMKIMFWR